MIDILVNGHICLCNPIFLDLLLKSMYNVSVSQVSIKSGGGLDKFGKKGNDST